MTRRSSDMLVGLLCALGAGLLWGMVFVAPLLLADYPPLLLSFGRYAGFGLVALLPAVLDRRRLAALTPGDWIAATKLSLVGNILYYAALASAVQLAGVPFPAMLIGTLPVVLAIAANLAPRDPSEFIPWKRIAPSLAIILAGMLLLNASELQHLGSGRTTLDYALGGLAAFGALATWTWYPIMNARHLHAHPQIRPSTWATAQGLATLPAALFGYLGYGLYLAVHGRFAFPLGPQPQRYLALMLGLGLCASWLGTVLWNGASRRLPASLSGQLIVFETLAALLYAFVWRRSLPMPGVPAGALLLVVGVMLAARAFRQDVKRQSGQKSPR